MRRRHLILGMPVLLAQTERSIKPVSGAPGRKALLIGNAKYVEGPLANPVHDAVDLGKSLEQFGFHITVVADASYGVMTSAVSKFAASLGAGDAALFYYSGHGVQLDGENYLVPVEFRASQAEHAKQSAVPFSVLKLALEKSPAAVTIQILDCCRNNPFAVVGQSSVSGLAALEAGLGSYIVFAAGPGQTASDNPSEWNGLFAKHLLQALPGQHNVSELFRVVRRAVYEASGEKQRPYLHDQLIADFYLKPPDHSPLPVVSAGSADVEEGKRLYQQARCREAVDILGRAVRRDPENALVQNALGLAYRCQGLNREAAASFSRAITLAPAYATAYLNRGDLYLSNTQYELAIQDFEWAIEQEPANAAPIAKRGRALLAMRRYEDAKADFSRALELDPSHADAYHGRGQVQHQLGKYNEAAADFGNAIARKSDVGAYWQDRARTRSRLGDEPGAKADLGMAQRLAKAGGL